MAMLVDSPRLSARDRESWERTERQDAVWCRTLRYRRRVERALDVLAKFIANGPCYAAVSWGKDSVVVADLALRVSPCVPLVTVTIEPGGHTVSSPECREVARRFLDRWPVAAHHEIVAGWIDGAPHPKVRGFTAARRRFGPRRISGMRAQESGERGRRGLSGEVTRHCCDPILYWSGADVFAYLHERGLPVHPAYAMTMGGLLDRERLRVGSLGGARGTGHGRREWERRYYGDRLAEIERETRCPQKSTNP